MGTKNSLTIYASDLDPEQEPSELSLRPLLNGMVEITIEDRKSVVLGADLEAILKYVSAQAEQATPHPDDPFRYITIGEPEPIGFYDQDNICGAYIHSPDYECLREPHPDGYVHISAADGIINKVWLTINNE